MDLSGKTYFVTGASRGIGRGIALKLASHGANIAVVAKTDEPHPTLKGTINSVADEIQAAGGQALPIKLDIRYEDDVEAAVKKTAEHFGGIDAVINNAGAIVIAPTERISIKQYDLMQEINARGTFVVTKFSVPYLKESENAHILSISPPVNMNSQWLAPSSGYTSSKYAATILTMAFAAEFKDYGIHANTLWPATTIDTAAVQVHFADHIPHSRKPDIVGDAAYTILNELDPAPTGQNFIDEEVLRQIGVDDFDKYAIDPSKPLTADLFLD